MTNASVFIEDAPAVASKPNPYAPLIEQLESAGEGKVARLVFEDEKAAQSALTKVQAAALDAGRSARRVGEIEEASDGFYLRVKLVPRRVRRTPEQIAADKAAAEQAKAAKAQADAKAAK